MRLFLQLASPVQLPELIIMASFDPELTLSHLPSHCSATRSRRELRISRHARPLHTQTLLNHAIYGDLTADALRSIFSQSGTSVISSTLSPFDVLLGISSGAIFIRSPGTGTPGAGIDTPDIAICSGVVHIIDAVLLPTRPEGPGADLPDGKDSMEAPAEGPGAEGPEADGPAGAPETGVTAAPAPAPPPAPAPEAAVRSPPGRTADPPQLEVRHVVTL